MLMLKTSFRCGSQYLSRNTHLSISHFLSRSRTSMATMNNHAATVKDTVDTAASVARPILLILDFDGTLTRRDTMHLVAEAGYAHQRASGSVTQPTPWSDIVDAYMVDFKTHVSNYEPRSSERTFPDQESAWLASLEEVEAASFKRACAAGIFDNITGDEMERAGRLAVQAGHVQLRAGWDKLLLRTQQHNARLSKAQLPYRLLSVNWSSTFIRGVLKQAFDEQQLSDLQTLDQHIYANEIPSILGENNASQSTSQPTIDHVPIRTSSAKVKLLRKFHKNEAEKEDALLVYVGDSTTDLDCLLESDLGFCIQDDPMGSGQKELAETCQRIGVKIFPITKISSQFATKNKIVWSVKDFSEIVDWLDKDNVT